MDYMSVKDASKKWGISEQRIRLLCQQERVKGAEKMGWVYLIPKDAEKPPRKVREFSREKV